MRRRFIHHGRRDVIHRRRWLLSLRSYSFRFRSCFLGGGLALSLLWRHGVVVEWTDRVFKVTCDGYLQWPPPLAATRAR